MSDEVVNPAVEVEESCKPKCIKYFLEYEACAERIKNDESGEAHCTGQYFDYWHCIDKCAAPQVFARLK